jgi:hypothetical protein
MFDGSHVRFIGFLGSDRRTGVVFKKELTPFAKSELLSFPQNSQRIGVSISEPLPLEEYKFRYFEEPVMFDHIEEIKQVADALTIPVANGEQDYNYYGFRWLIAHDGLDIVQPDNYYFGGLIRSMKVARMAAAYGKQCVPHMSGGELGNTYNIQFVSALSNAGEHHEFGDRHAHPVRM